MSSTRTAERESGSIARIEETLGRQAQLPTAPSSALPQGADGAEYALSHFVETRIRATEVGTEPFRHLYVEDVFTADFYDALRTHMLNSKHGAELQDRTQDSHAFKNKRFSLAKNQDEIVSQFRIIFDNSQIKRSIIEKFYLQPVEHLVDSLVIHEEFEYVFTNAGRFQNIHIDIPPKFLSFVFYIPEVPAASPEQEGEMRLSFTTKI